jgi:hypothetical protein
MRKSAIWILLIAVIVGLAGCGGNNGGFRGPTPFTGSYSGTWSVPSGADIGTMTLTIADDATMVGTYLNAATGEHGTVRGATHPEGGFNMTFTDTAGAVTAITGIMANSGSRGGLAGDGTLTRPGGGAQGFTFDLDRDQGESPFAGTFGAWFWLDGHPSSNPPDVGTEPDGIMNLTISGGGQITGTFETATQNGRAAGQVDIDGNFDMFFVDLTTGARSEVRGTMIIDTTTFSTAVWAGDGTLTGPDGIPHAFHFESPIPQQGTTATSTTAGSVHLK